MLKAIVFDLDGTILNSIIGIKDSINEGLKVINASPITEEEAIFYIGDGIEELIKRSIVHSRDNNKIRNVSQSDYQSVLETYLKYYEDYRITRTSEFEGMTETLLKLKKAGYILIVLSNKLQSDVEPMMDYFFKDIFTESLGDSPLVGRKPDILGIKYIKNKYNLTNDEILYVGDSHVDMEFARNANIDVVACMYGYERIYSILEYNPKYTINKPAELLNILNIK